MTHTNEDLLDQLVSQCKTKEDITGKDGLLQQLLKRALQQALNTELEEHLGYKKNASQGKNTGNSRNGHTKKTLKGEHGSLELETPRDRNGTFEPQIVQKNQTRFDGFDDKIIALYSKGMTTRDIQDTLKELYGVDVSHSLISRVTEGLKEDMESWQQRMLSSMYPIPSLDCVVVKVKQDNQIINKAIYLALAVNIEGQKELLGMWISENEGAKFWLGVLTELKNRGLQDILIACVDGLKGFPEAIKAAYPETQVQLCIVHQVRHSLKYVPHKDMKAVARDLKKIYGAATLEAAEMALSAFSDDWDSKYPSISKSWLNHWENLSTLFHYPPDIRRVIYTTNAIESLNMVIRKAIRNRRMFPCDNSAFKVVFLAIQGASKKWTMPIHHRKPALNHFNIVFGDRCPV